MGNDKVYDWGELEGVLNSKYKYYHEKSPYPFNELSFNEIIDFGEISDNVYENPIVTALCLNGGKSLLSEAEYATYPIDTTINYVSRALNIPIRMFAKCGDKYNGVWFIKIKSFNDKETKENINKAMHLCGYYLAKEGIYGDDNRYSILRYEPKYIDDANYRVSQCEYLYHLSPLKYKDKILKNGFVPKSNNGLFKYPDRCYFFMDDLSKNEILSWIPAFNKANKRNGNVPYCLYTIDVSKINYNTTLYLDPNLRSGCYTADNISPNVIIDIEDINNDSKVQ